MPTPPHGQLSPSPGLGRRAPDRPVSIRAYSQALAAMLEFVEVITTHQAPDLFQASEATVVRLLADSPADALPAVLGVPLLAARQVDRALPEHPGVRHVLQEMVELCHADIYGPCPRVAQLVADAAAAIDQRQVPVTGPLEEPGAREDCAQAAALAAANCLGWSAELTGRSVHASFAYLRADAIAGLVGPLMARRAR
jgi:hypothetical protein